MRDESGRRGVRTYVAALSFMPRNTRLACVLFLAAALAYPKLEIQSCGAYPGLVQEELALHRNATPLRLAKRAARLAPATSSRPAARDAGNIAILEDADGVVERRNAFNLPQRTIGFTRNASAYRFAVTDATYDSALAQAGTRVDGLGDDDTRAISLPFAFPFYGANYDRIFLNSDGNLTFGAGDAASSGRSLGRMTAGAPRIAGFFEDLDPTAVGDVRVTSQAASFAVSWVGVPEYSTTPGAPRNTFQIVLYPDGRVVLAYGEVNSRNAVVGLAPGGVQGGTSVVNFTGGSAAEFAGAVVERFTNIEEIDTVFAAQKFFETHDYLVFYNNLGVAAASGAVAFESSVRSIVDGIGDKLVDAGRDHGSPRRLQAIMNMGPLTQYPRDPNAFVPARSTSRDTPLTVLGHEAGHLWLAFASVREPGNATARPMLGRQTAHWAFNFNSEASLLEGNRIQDNGPGTLPRFRTVATVEGYAPLDQYLMGLRAPDEVPPTFYVTGTPFGLPSAPQSGVSFNGERRDVAIDEIAGAEGRRTPDHTVSQRRFRFAFILIISAAQQPTAEQLAQLEGYRAAFPAFFERASGGRASAETTLQQNLQLSLAPAGGVVEGSVSVASVSLQQAAASDLTVLLRSSNGIARTASSVTIRAGERRATFLVQGLLPGVEELTAEPSDSRYATAFARIPVSARESLRLTIVSGNAQSVPARGALPQPLVLRVVDVNKVPYAGQAVTARVTSGTVDRASAVSDEDGLVRFNWTPDSGPLFELTAAIGGASVTMNAVGKPFIASGGIVNSASFTPGITPGGLATIFGASLTGGVTDRATSVPLPTRLSGVRVTVAGQLASLVYVSDRQINFVAPASIVAAATADVVVSWGSETVSASVPFKTADPGIFMIDGERSGAVLIAGTGQTTLARPAAAGEVLEIYLTGLGPQSSVGTLVTVGGREAEVLFAGATPSFPGLDQVNIRVPAGLAAGSQPLSIRTGAATSNEVLIRLR